ncbi:MAG: hypothetical protein JNJ73_04395 [Hyphomonadaceae bacterium]|nr:hypothetical protein [Hyphomonadaceae bacterium]
MSEERLARALGAARPAARDNAFVLGVLERGEQERFKRATLHAVLRGAAIAAAAAALIAFLADWIGANADAVIDGATISAALALLMSSALATARRLGAR